MVISSSPGDFGKPRPALVVQSNFFNPTHASIVVCPITSHLVDTPLFRLTIRPSAENGLKVESQIMVDKLTAVKREHIGKKIGRIGGAQATELDHALRLWLDLGAR
ncbi:MAG TPA: type II toxin-antitoxin system PemK/MazF family toxin [Bryobacteraceae bacterium]|nr:type II toxin-antitoxin system PemK/MazF family toxin [Bryobacteraceae bacterium]